MTNLALRDKRHKQLRALVDRTRDYRDGTLARLVHFETKLKSLEKKLQRSERSLKALRQETLIEQTEAKTVEMAAVKTVNEAIREMAKPPAPVNLDDQLEVPDFLRRTGSIGNLTPADLKAMKEIEEAKDERKRTKARVRDETRKAKATGATRAMPLEGKAALAKIRAG